MIYFIHNIRYKNEFPYKKKANFTYMEKSNIYIGRIIAEVMANKKISKAEMARRLKVRPQSVDYMLGRKSIDTDTLYNVSLALDYDFAQLFSIRKNQTKSDIEHKSYDKIKKAKLIVELELGEDDISQLNIKKKILTSLE